MRMRDRRGPLTAIVLGAAYLLLLIAGVLWLAGLFGLGRPWAFDPLLKLLIAANSVSFGWRATMRFAFTTREYGPAEGIRAVLRIPVSNIIAIIAGRRALFGYVRSLGGTLPQWDKTRHDAHPVLMRREAAA
jgi:adsorption protein B